MDMARKLLTKLRHVPNPTPAKLLAEFKRLKAAECRKVAKRTDGRGSSS
jgi:hypothetical protein